MDFSHVVLIGLLSLFTFIINKFRSVLNALKLVKLFLLSIFYIFDILLSIFTFIYSIICYCISSNQNDNNNNNNNESVKTIVIIGYSFAGFEVHKNLQNNSSLSHYKFIIIEPKTYFEFTPTILEAVTNPLKYKSISLPFREYFDSTNSTLIHGQVISIDFKSNCVIVKEISHGLCSCGTVEEHLDTIHFDYCFVCTGSKYQSPFKVNTHSNVGDNIHYKNRISEIEKIYSKLYNNKMKSVAIIGGGPVGVELMAEIIYKFPNKNITIIDAHERLCRQFPESTKNYLDKWIKKHENITLKLNTRIKEIVFPNYVDDKECKWCDDNVCKHDTKTAIIVDHIHKRSSIKRQKSRDKNQFKYQLKSKLQSEFDGFGYDLIFCCVGFAPNSEILNNEKYKNVLTEKYKFIKVDEWMRINIINNKNVFALGDVISQPRINEIKLAHTAEIHAKYISDLMGYLNKNKNENINEFIPYHQWLLGNKIIENESDDNYNINKKWNMPKVFSISLGKTDGTMGFGNIFLNGIISIIFKWFIQISLCKLWQRKPIFSFKIKENVIFRLYPIGYRIFTLIWKLNHMFTIWYIRHFN
eukprot:241075_1